MNYNYEYNKGLRIDELNSYKAVLSEHLTSTDRELLDEYIEKWNFYEGYHWENIELQDKPQVTKNYCRAFVNKFVAFDESVIRVVRESNCGQLQSVQNRQFYALQRWVLSFQFNKSQIQRLVLAANDSYREAA